MNQKEIDAWLATCAEADTEDAEKIMEGIYKIVGDPLLLNSVARIIIQKGVGSFLYPSVETEKEEEEQEVETPVPANTFTVTTGVTWEVNPPWLRVKAPGMELPSYFTMEGDDTIKTRIGTGMHERVRKFFDKKGITIPDARTIALEG